MNKFYLSHPIFPSSDIEKTCSFYVDKLGFRPVRYLDSSEPHICLYKDTVEIVLTDSRGKKVIPNRELYGYGYDVYIIVKDHESLQKEFEEKEIKIVRKVSVTDYENKELVIEDVDRRWIAFGLKIATSPKIFDLSQV